MNNIVAPVTSTSWASAGKQSDFKLEVVVLPVSDVDRSKDFYDRLGWRLDGDFVSDDGRLLQFTPPGSPCSIIFSTAITPSAVGPLKHLFLVVADIEEARAELVARGVQPSEVFHDANGGYNFYDPSARASGPDPDRRSYASFLTFSDPDGNLWLLQEVTARFPGRVDPSEMKFASVPDLAAALRRAAAAHGQHEARIGVGDPNWPDWYAAYMVAEQAGTELPT
jgi:catechol 2,3-dioxygenase-like lactoylglutathione lyase family enzyme